MKTKTNPLAIVPPKDLCKKIPKDKFQDSVLIWGIFNEILFIDIRTEAWDTEIVAPAPTLEELFKEFDKMGFPSPNCWKECSGWKCDCLDKNLIDVHYILDPCQTAVEAVLKLWFKINSIKF